MLFFASLCSTTAFLVMPIEDRTIDLSGGNLAHSVVQPSDALHIGSKEELGC